ncbi:MAG: phage gp6-like head-tail connector protein [Clostridiales bacterium]|nr:phage gp6-like head-tail connector protein [Clostridiales bacterium]
MLEKVKLALRITTTAFDSELNDLIDAAKVDLGIAGVVVPVTTETPLDVIIQKAIITYCKLNFGEPDEYERLKRSYDEQKAQLSMATGYTTWIDQT